MKASAALFQPSIPPPPSKSDEMPHVIDAGQPDRVTAGDGLTWHSILTNRISVYAATLLPRVRALTMARVTLRLARLP